MFLCDNLIFRLIYVLISYFLGGIMFCALLPKKLEKIDISALSDDHNPGATNVFLNCGAGLGFVCLILDILKGFIPVYIACRMGCSENLFFSLVIIAPVLGHASGVFNHFHGGKCIATIFGTMLGLLPVSSVVLFLAFLYILFSVILRIKPDKKSSIITFTIFGIVGFIVELLMGRLAISIGCAVISIIAIIKHLMNDELRSLTLTMTNDE